MRAVYANGLSDTHIISQIANVRVVLVARRVDSRMSANVWHSREGSRMRVNMQSICTNADARDDFDMTV